MDRVRPPKATRIVRPSTGTTWMGLMPAPPRSPDLPSPEAAVAAPEPGAPAFVWGVLFACVATAAALVVAYGPDVPIADDYAVVPVLTGERRADVGWLWAQHNEHRIPLLKVVLLASIWGTGGDFRAGMFVTVATLGLTALGLIVAVGKLRGGTRYADAFLPVVLLNLGHHADFLWSFEIGFVLSAALALAMFLLIVGRNGWPWLGTAALGSLILAALLGCTASGLAFVPALLAWLWASAAAHWRSGRPRGRLRGSVILGMTLPALVLTVLYFRGYRRPPNQSLPTGPADALRCALQFLSLGFGTGARSLWPIFGAVSAGLIALAAVLLLAAWLRRPAERPRIVGLVAFLVAVLTLAMGIGWGRSGGGEAAGLQDRYVTLACPALVFVFFTCELYGGPATRRLAPMVLLSLSLVTLWPNTVDGLVHGRTVAARVAAFHRDLRAGVPTYMLLRRYTPFLHPSPDELAVAFRGLRRAGVGPFRGLKDDPPFREIPVPPAPVGISLARWEGGLVRVTGVDPWITFALPEPRYVCGIRLRYSHCNPAGTDARFRVAWTRADQPVHAAGQEFAIWGLPSGRDRDVTVWICEDIARFRIQPDNQPCEFRISKLVLLVP